MGLPRMYERPAKISETMAARLPAWPPPPRGTIVVSTSATADRAAITK